MYVVSTNEGHIIKGNTMEEIVFQLPLFNDFISNNLDNLIKLTTEEFSINEKLIEAIKTNNPLNISGLDIDDWIRIINVTKIDS